MKTIKTFNSKITTTDLSTGRNNLALPRRAQMLAVAADSQGFLVVAVAVNPDEEVSEERVFWAASQDQRIPVGAGRVTHHGSAPLRDHTLWHVFEINSPEDAISIRPGTMRGDTHVTNQQTGPVHGTSLQVGIAHGIAEAARRGVRRVSVQ